ncbi:aminotransferase class I/II-fold pyridoxal phosphate-dependent enzyme [Clostridium paraputrificum]|uniref:Arginine decarboxylase n=1 Tax=Clostridium paraputrificum TaxID=29363 RepID=A0A6N3AE94_9CLOT
MNKELPLLQALIDYHKEENTIFSMPGNKCGLAFSRDEIGSYLRENLGRLDITEVDPLDNLHHPEGVIKESQELLAKYYGVKKAYFLVNGSSSGNLSSIFAAFNEGDEVLVERNCHKSVYNGLILRKLKVRYIEPVVFGDGGLFLPPDKNNIYSALQKCDNPKGIILTYPNYFGISYDMEEIIKDLKKRGLKIIIDEAHGAHYGVCENLPENIAPIADYTVVSAHKTLPALTGGAYLLVNDENDNIDFYISAFMTTSPSYLIMASLDYARFYLSKYGEEDYRSLINKAEKGKKKVNELCKVRVLSKEELPKGYEIDLSRYVLVLPKGYSGGKLQDYLRSKKIQCEMSFFSGVVLLLSPVNVDSGLEKLYKALEELDMDLIKNEEKSIKFNYVIPEKGMEPYEVFNHKGELVKLDYANGKIVKEAIVPYPPGTPLVSSGEKITQEIIEEIKGYLNEGISILGVHGDKVLVVNK